MANIADNLNTLRNTTEDIRTAIVNKGQTPSGGLTTFSEAIGKISTGSNVDYYPLLYGKIICENAFGERPVYSGTYFDPIEENPAYAEYRTAVVKVEYISIPRILSGADMFIFINRIAHPDGSYEYKINEVSISGDSINKDDWDIRHDVTSYSWSDLDEYASSIQLRNISTGKKIILEYKVSFGTSIGYTTSKVSIHSDSTDGATFRLAIIGKIIGVDYSTKQPYRYLHFR